MTDRYPEPDDLRDAADVFGAVRGKLFGVAYRMMGSVSDAEDIVQSVWVKWQSYDRSVVRDPTAFLVSATTRLCITELSSARVRRETYIGPWLPEPVDTSADPALGAERAEALELATLMLLEKLTPTERAAYVLREAFDYPYTLIGDTIQTSESNARQLARRARTHLTGERRALVDSDEHHRLLTAFLAAAKNGNMEELEELLAADAVSYTDGNGARHAAKMPVVGSHTIARFVVAFRERVFETSDLRWVSANGRPAVVVSVDDGVFETLLSVSASDQGIEQLMWFRTEVKVAQFI